MEEFEYPMWFEAYNGEVVKFNGLQLGEVVKKSLDKYSHNVGFTSTCFYPHTNTEVWKNVTEEWKEKEILEDFKDTIKQAFEQPSIPPLEMCGTLFCVEKKERYNPTLKEALEKLIKEEKPNKYKRKVPSTKIDVYDILKAFNVVNPATQHAIKKLLCAGDRGYKDKVQDLKEALESISRAIELEIDNVEA